MIKGIGVDIVEIDRIKEAIEKFGDRFLNRIYTPEEVDCCSHRGAYKFPELSARFAAKEAYAKALGTGISGDNVWSHIEIKNNKLGQPFIYLRGKRARGVHLSLSHSRKDAIAMVVIEE